MLSALNADRVEFEQTAEMMYTSDIHGIINIPFVDWEDYKWKIKFLNIVPKYDKASKNFLYIYI